MAEDGVTTPPFQRLGYQAACEAAGVVQLPDNDNDDDGPTLLDRLLQGGYRDDDPPGCP